LYLINLAIFSIFFQFLPTKRHTRDKSVLKKVLCVDVDTYVALMFFIDKNVYRVEQNIYFQKSDNILGKK